MQVPIGEFIERLKGTKYVKVSFDIETGPLPDEQLYEFFDPTSIALPEHPGTFDPNKVAVSHLKDPFKIASKIDAAREKHARALQSYAQEVEEARDEAWEDFVNSAPLNAAYSQVVAIGYGMRVGQDLLVAIDIDDERQMLDSFVTVERMVFLLNGRLIGHNSARFDIPFITRRCWSQNIPFEYPITRYKTPSDHFADTLVRWSCGDNRTSIKLDHLAKALGVPGKYGELTGDKFWKALRDGNQAEAIKYLESDIVATHLVAERLGLA